MAVFAAERGGFALEPGVGGGLAVAGEAGVVFDAQLLLALFKREPGRFGRLAGFADAVVGAVCCSSRAP